MMLTGMLVSSLVCLWHLLTITSAVKETSRILTVL